MLFRSGVGKTRLAQAAAEAGAEAFRHGALCLSGRDPGAALRDPETLVQQVIAHTGPDRDRPGALLLVLDNLETVSAVPALARVLHERADGVTVLLIEHDVNLVMGLCDRVAVLDFGRKIAEDVPAAVQRDQAVIDAYLGGGRHAA